MKMVNNAGAAYPACCRNCAFAIAKIHPRGQSDLPDGWKDAEGQDYQYLECRYNEPAPVVQADAGFPSFAAYWPVVDPDDWCRRFELDPDDAETLNEITGAAS